MIKKLNYHASKIQRQHYYSKVNKKMSIKITNCGRVVAEGAVDARGPPRPDDPAAALEPLRAPVDQRHARALVHVPLPVALHHVQLKMNINRVRKKQQQKHFTQIR